MGRVISIFTWLLRYPGLYIGGPYLGIVLILFFFQRSMVYIPRQVDKVPRDIVGLSSQQLHDVSITTSDEITLNGWHLLAGLKSAKDRIAVDQMLEGDEFVFLYFPGNAGNRSFRADIMKILAGLPAHVFIFDYRGYGDNAGSPSEKNLIEDAHSIWKYLTVSRKIPPSRILIYGESLGGGVACRLAGELSNAGTPPAALITQATFSDLASAGQYAYPIIPVRWILIDRYQSIKHIRSVRCPILLFHGPLDEIIPYKQAEQLYEAAPEQSDSGVDKILIPIDGARHNDVVEIGGPTIRRTLAELIKKLKSERQAQE